MLRIVFVFACVLLLNASPSGAADPLPEMPAPLQNLVNEGAQVRYLGKDHGLDAWLTVKNGQEQYFYVMPDKKAFMMGILFDADGKVVTVDQVQRLRAQGDTLLDTLTDIPVTNEPDKKQAFEFKTPSEQLFADIEASNWVSLGPNGAPVMYAFIDPQCPHCHSFVDALRKQNYFAEGKVQLRIIPVGFQDETRAQAAFLIASPNPEQRWFAHMDGDQTALPAKSDIGQQGVQRNMAIMQSWKFDVTPMVVYRAKDGTVKLVRGAPQDLPAVISDLEPRKAP
jgi:thiol:disulfide interchange protein DsbG